MRLPHISPRLAAIAAAGTVFAAASGALSPPSRAASPVERTPISVGVQSLLRSLSGAALDRRIGALRANGIQYSREDFIWSTIEPQPGRFCWDEYDLMMAAAAKAGLRIIAIPDAPPAWASSAFNAAPVGGAVASYARFVREVVRRYGSRGTFWAQHPKLRRLPIEYVNVWNEPYSKEFWARNFPDPSGYARLFEAAVTAARPADPEVKFMLEADTTSFNGGKPFLSRLFDAVPRLGSLADVVSVHPYASNGWSPQQCATGGDRQRRRYQVCRITDIRRELDARGAGHVPLWITEVGWSTAPDAPDGVSEMRQAEYVHELFGLLRGSWKGLVNGVVWYSYSTPERNRASREEWFGLVHPTGVPKPGWGALKAEAAVEALAARREGVTPISPPARKKRRRSIAPRRPSVAVPHRVRRRQVRHGLRIGIWSPGGVRFRTAIHRRPRGRVAVRHGAVRAGRHRVRVRLPGARRPGLYRLTVRLRWAGSSRLVSVPVRVTR